MATYWTRSRFAQWAQANALKPEIPAKLEREYGSVDNMELWGCPDFLYGDEYRVPLPDGWCDYCKGEPLPHDYRKWHIKVWVPKHPLQVYNKKLIRLAVYKLSQHVLWDRNVTDLMLNYLVE